MLQRTPLAILVSLVCLAALPAGCRRDAGPDATVEVTRLNAETEGLRQKLAAAEKGLAAQQDAEVLAVENSAAVKKQAVEREQAAGQKDAQIRALQTELAELKKSEVMVFAEISRFQQQGLTSIALGRYEQFLKDFPNSPLAAHAVTAMAQLAATAEREAKARVSVNDPKRKEREILKYLADGTATAEEVAPLFKNRTPAEVIKLLGPPNRTFRNGTEFGYVDKISDSATGAKNTLVISFEEDRVTGVRAGYQGRIIKP